MPNTPNRLLPYPSPSEPPDVQGDLQALAEAADLNTRSRVFADEAARDAALPSPVTGMECWVGERKYVYADGMWVLLFGSDLYFSADGSASTGTPANTFNPLTFPNSQLGDVSWYSEYSPDTSGGVAGRITPNVPGFYVLMAHAIATIASDEWGELRIVTGNPSVPAGINRAGDMTAGAVGNSSVLLNASFGAPLNGVDNWVEIHWRSKSGQETVDADVTVFRVGNL